MIRILLTEDNAVVRNALATYLNAQPDMIVVATASNGKDGLKLLKEQAGVDILLTDLDMPGDGGIAFARHAHQHYPLLRIIVLSLHHYPGFIANARAAGVCAYLSKEGELPDLLTAIRDVALGQYVFPAT